MPLRICGDALSIGQGRSRLLREWHEDKDCGLLLRLRWNLSSSDMNAAPSLAANEQRKGLFEAAHTGTITTPPLRKRASDVPLLVDHFLGEAEQKINTPASMELSKKQSLSYLTMDGLAMCVNFGMLLKGY